ncbi:MAG: hypothetical protein ACI9WU_002406 [Myxococcota bacterium]|jgi:hypothetical protein
MAPEAVRRVLATGRRGLVVLEPEAGWIGGDVIGAVRAVAGHSMLVRLGAPLSRNSPSAECLLDSPQDIEAGDGSYEATVLNNG